MNTEIRALKRFHKDLDDKPALSRVGAGLLMILVAGVSFLFLGRAPGLFLLPSDIVFCYGFYWIGKVILQWGVTIFARA